MEVEKAFSLIKELQKSFSQEMGQIKLRYLNKHIDNINIDLSEWKYDLQTCVILTHAAVENYIEVLSIIIIKSAYYEYKTKNFVSSVLLKFCWLRMELFSKFNENAWDNDNLLFTKDLEEAISTYTSYINEKNHGIKIKNLNIILRPVDLSMTDQTFDDFSVLAENRGQYAHRYLVKGLDLARITQAENPERILSLIQRVELLVFNLHIKSILKLNLNQSDQKKYFLQNIVNCLNTYSKIKKNEQNLFE